MPLGSPKQPDEFAPTPEQREVISHRGRHMLVFAGPGTGKTETLARRFASIVVDDGAKASDILVLTFSRSAAQAMRDRILLRLRERQGEGLGVSELFVRTFHGFCARLLDGDDRARQRHLLTPVKERLLWQRVIGDVGLETISSEVAGSSAFAADMLTYIAQCKGEGRSPDDLLRDARGDGRMADIAALYRAMEGQRVRLGLSDFRDLVAEAVRALGDAGSPSSRWLALRGPFRHILVDEFQDSDPMQLRLLERLAGHDWDADKPIPEMCFVGDFNQSIYRFRGASPNNILEVEDRFRCLRFSLHLNRRSAQAVLDVANQTPGLRGESLTQAEDQGKTGCVQLRQASMGDDEIALVCGAVAEKLNGGTQARDVAVLLRVNQPYQSLISQELMARGIPVAARPTEGFHEDSLVSALITALKLLVDPQDAALKRRLQTNPVVGFPPLSLSLGGHGARMTQAQFTTAWRAIEELHAANGDVPTLIRAIASGLDLLEPVRSGRKVAGFDAWASPARLTSLLHAATDMHDMVRALGGETAGAPEFLDRLDEIIGLIANPAEATPHVTNGVRVMSIHAAKGLEFDFVVIPQCLEGVLPAVRRRNALLPDAADMGPGGGITDAEQALREEASLWYVALTRARHGVLATATLVDDDGVEQILSRFAGPIADRERTSTAGYKRTHYASFGHDGAFEPQAPCAIIRRLDTLSATSVNDFLICPRRFFYSDVLQLPKRDLDEARIGSFVHLALQRFHESHRDFTDAHAVARDRDAHIEHLCELAAQAARQTAAKNSLPEHFPKLDYEIERAKRKLAHYVDWLIQEAARYPFTVLANEQRIEIDLGAMRLLGRVDRIDKLSAGSIAIRDYKTGKFRGQGCAAMARELLASIDKGDTPFGIASRNTNIQTLLYVSGVEALTGGRVGRLEYIYLGGKEDGKSGDDRPASADSIALIEDDMPSAWSEESFMTRSEIVRVRDELAAGIDRLCVSGELSAFYTTSDAASCTYCDHVKVCPGPGAVPAKTSRA